MLQQHGHEARMLWTDCLLLFPVSFEGHWMGQGNSGRTHVQLPRGGWRPPTLTFERQFAFGPVGWSLPGCPTNAMVGQAGSEAHRPHPEQCQPGISVRRGARSRTQTCGGCDLLNSTALCSDLEESKEIAGHPDTPDQCWGNLTRSLWLVPLVLSPVNDSSVS